MRAVILALVLSTAVHAQPQKILSGAGSDPYVFSRASSSRVASTSAGGDGVRVPLSAGDEHDNVEILLVDDEHTRLLSAGLQSGTVASQDPDTGAHRWTLTVGNGLAGFDARGPVGVASISDPASVAVLDLSMPAVTRTVSVPSTPTSVVLSDDGQVAAVGLLDNQIAILDPALGQVRRVIDVEFRRAGSGRRTRANRKTQFYTPFALSPDGSRLIVGTRTEAVTFDVETGDVVHRLPLREAPSTVLVSASGARVAVMAGGRFSAQRYLVTYDLGGGDEREVALGFDPNGADLVFSEDGAHALVVAQSAVLFVTPGASPETSFLVPAERVADIGGGKAAAYDPVSAYQIDMSTGDVGAVVGLPLVPGGFPEAADVLASGGDGSSFTWSYWKERAQHADFDASQYSVYPLGAGAALDVPRRLALSPDGESIAVCFLASGRAAVMDAATRDIRVEFDAGIRFPENVAFLSSGDLVVIGNRGVQRGGVIARFDADTGVERQRLDLVTTDAAGVFVRSERVYVSSRGDGLLSEFEIVEGDLVFRQTHNSGGTPEISVLSWTPLYVDVSPDGAYSIGFDSIGDLEIAVVDLETGDRTSFPATPDTEHVAFTADGSRAAVTSFDGQLTLIDLSGTPTRSTSTMPTATSAITFDEASGVFVVGSDRWNGEPGNLLYRVDPVSGAIVGQDALPDGFRIHSLHWDSEAGTVATGSLPPPDGHTRIGAVATPTNVVQIDRELGHSVYVPSTGEMVSAIPGTDELLAVAARPVSTAPSPEASAYTLTPLANPSASGVRVRLSGPASPEVRVDVVDVLGRVVARLYEGAITGEDRILEWDGAAPGTYVVRVAGSGASAQVTVVR